MTTTWVVIAHQAGARIMEHRSGFGRNLSLVCELHNPDARKRNHDLESDRAGETFTATKGVTGRRAMQREHTAHDHVVEQFVRELADHLHRTRAEGAFDDLILVADPKLLGSLRQALDKATAHKVVASMSKDLAAVSSAEVAKYVSDVLPL